MKKILIVFGTRPEAIKMASLVKEFQKNTDAFITKVCVTAQHREMLDQVLEFFNIIPDYDLNIMKQGQDLYDVTSSVLLGMKGVLEDFKPDVVFVHGDTSTTFAVSLAAYYKQIKISHVEAGLRTGNIYSPWPEEANRKLTTQITNFHFAPTITSKENLLKENVSENTIDVTGNTVIDALFMATDNIKKNDLLESRIVSSIYKLINDSIFDVYKSQFILVTGHRRENHGQGFVDICKALRTIAKSNHDIHIVYPVHLNPNVQGPVNDLLSGVHNIHLIKPLQYEQFVFMMYQSYLIITDSGGIQEEAPSFGKPVLVMRDTTERPEAIEAGTVKLVGTNSNTIIKETQFLIDSKEAYMKMSRSSNPYGDGKASKNIVQSILDSLNKI